MEFVEFVMVNMRFLKNYLEKLVYERFFFFGVFFIKENVCCKMGGGGGVRG